MYQIVYRKKPLQMFYLHVSEGDVPDLDKEFEDFKEKHPEWDVYIIEPDADMVTYTMIRESGRKET